MIEKSPILVTGCARSGTSTIAGIINMCGAFGGNVAVANSNRRGMFENGCIRDNLVKPYLVRIGADPNGQYPLPVSISIPTTWKQLVEKVMLAEGYKGGDWLYKDTRMGLMWRVWNYAYPNAKWVIVRRRTGDVIQSCIKTGFMKAFNNQGNREAVNANTEEEAWLWWVHEYEKRFADMIMEGLNIKVVWPERMVDGDFRQLYELIDWLGLKWNPGAMVLIESLLWGNKLKRKEATYGTGNVG